MQYFITWHGMYGVLRHITIMPVYNTVYTVTYSTAWQRVCICATYVLSSTAILKIAES